MLWSSSWGQKHASSELTFIVSRTAGSVSSSSGWIPWLSLKRQWWPTLPPNGKVKLDNKLDQMVDLFQSAQS